MADDILQIKDVHVNVDDKEIIKGVSLDVKPGEVHVIMGPNGSGKSTLSNAIMGHPRYTVTQGEIIFQGENIVGLSPDRRARRGLFLAFQNPLAVPGVSVSNFLRTALTNRRKGDVKAEVRPENLDIVGDRPVYETKKASVGGDGALLDRSKKKEALISPKEFRAILKEKLNLLHMDEKFTRRYLNDGFSGGEKKRLEVLQMAVLNPSVAILDEPDSGLDVDAIRIVGEGVSALRGKDMAVVVITHQQRILSYLDVDYVHVMMQGKIVKEGGPELSKEIEERGYGWIREELGLTATKEEAAEEVGANA
ncbi:MAG TPA: ATP-binding cassette domain-containing protein [Chloroflexia bacterium]|nr:ATP-binding cassette domain-containing protein [Chloroflexia bacterium]